MHGHKREKNYPIMLSQKHHNFAMPKHIDVIHDWWALRSFLVLPVKKSYMSVKYKRLLNRTHHKHEPQSSLA